jgi:hypothetical protein
LRADVGTGKRVFTIAVPSSTKHIRVLMGPAEPALSWSLNVEPSPEAERICTFEVSQPVVEPSDSSKFVNVTVTCKLTTPTSSAESPLKFGAEEPIKPEEIVSFADSAKPGLYKLNTGVVLGHLKLGTAQATPLTLFVMDEHAVAKP